MSLKNTIDLSGLSKQYAARDLPAETRLKYRESGQAAPDELRKDRKDLKKDLEERERLSTSKDGKRLSLSDKEAEKHARKHKSEQPPMIAPVNLDADEVIADSSDEDEEKPKKKFNRVGDSDESEDEDNDDEEEEEDDDDDTEALMAELNRIKQERAAEAARQEEERKIREEKIRVENILKGNPLLNTSSKAGTSSGVDFKVKRRWDDDVVFKNCAKLDDNKKKGFVNDTLRSEFHKKFMDRYIK